MTEMASGAASVGRKSNTEKPLDEQQSAIDDVPIKVEPPESLAYDANSLEKADDSAEKESQGSMRDYFVSAGRKINLNALETDALILLQRIFHYADRLDRFLYAIAIAGAIAVGAALPLMTLVFGSSTSSFNHYAVGQGNPQQFQNQINHLVLYFVYLFVGRFVIGYVATLCICIAAARTTNSLRKAFLESLLRQEISHFDKEGNGSPATQVTTSTSFSTM